MTEHTDDWLARFAEALDQQPLTETEIDTLLDLTREVAHGTVRRYAPLAAYLAGAAATGTGDAHRPEAVGAIAERLRAVLPPTDGPEAGDRG